MNEESEDGVFSAFFWRIFFLGIIHIGNLKGI
jgi:hypothetical protein